MPTMSGLELQAHLLAEGYRVPFIFITAFSGENARARALKAGASCFLTKPFAEDALINCLDTALEEHGAGTSKWSDWVSAASRASGLRSVAAGENNNSIPPTLAGSRRVYVGMRGPTI